MNRISELFISNDIRFIFQAHCPGKRTGQFQDQFLICAGINGTGNGQSCSTFGPLYIPSDGIFSDFSVLAEGLIQQWKAIGVEATLRSTTPAAASTFVLNRNFDAALIELGLVADPDPYPLWHSTQASETGQNISGFANEEADITMEAIRATTDQEELIGLYQRFQGIFGEEVPALLLYHPIYTYAVDAQVQQVQLAPMLHTSNRFQNVAEWTVETEEIQVSEGEPLDKNEE